MLVRMLTDWSFWVMLTVMMVPMFFGFSIRFFRVDLQWSPEEAFLAACVVAVFWPISLLIVVFLAVVMTPMMLWKSLRGVPAGYRQLRTRLQKNTD